MPAGRPQLPHASKQALYQRAYRARKQLEAQHQNGPAAKQGRGRPKLSNPSPDALRKRTYRIQLLKRLMQEQRRRCREAKVEKELRERNQDGRKGLLLRSCTCEQEDCTIGACECDDKADAMLGRMRCCGTSVCKHCITTHFAMHNHSIDVGYTDGVHRVHEDPITIVNGWARQGAGHAIKVTYDAYVCPFCRAPTASSLRRSWTQ